MHTTRPFRGVNGARIREDDEGHGTTMTARFPGHCSVTGRAISIGDTIRYDRRTRTTVLVAARTVSDTFETSGGVFYRNRNGRCEDAPACGCCTI